MRSRTRQASRRPGAMVEERLYRREGLTLAALAQALGIGEAALRAQINQELGYRNFNDFLHHYRLQEASARLAKEALPILTIALECGYGSIGPFNRAFKQRMGMTPSEYRGATRLAQGAATNRSDFATNRPGIATNRQDLRAARRPRWLPIRCRRSLPCKIPRCSPSR